MTNPPLGDHWLHGMRNEDPGGGEAENRAGQAGDQDVKGCGLLPWEFLRFICSSQLNMVGM
jgi:hypothetical protein